MLWLSVTWSGVRGVVHVSEKKIFFKSFQNYKNNIEEDWKIISSIIGKNSSQLNVHEQLEIDGVNTEA